MGWANTCQLQKASIAKRTDWRRGSKRWHDRSILSGAGLLSLGHQLKPRDTIHVQLTNPRIGATGKTGRRVAAKLEALGHTVRRGSRRSETPFDWEATETWGPALDGVDAAYVTYFSDLAFPGGVENVGALAAQAEEIGVERFLLLSGRGEQHAKLGEEAVKASGPDVTIVRSTWFAQNFSEGYLRDPILAGVLPVPGGAITDPIIDIEDVADVVVAALTEDGHAGETYEVTGPRLMGWADMAEELSRAIGRPIRHVPISLEEFHGNVAQSDGDFVADVFTAIARETLDGP